MKKIIALLLASLMLCAAIPALAQEISCPPGGFSLTVPDSFSPVSPMPQDQDLVFAWQGGGISLHGYATAMSGKVRFNDLYQILTGQETESGSLTIRGVDMLYARGSDQRGPYALYIWMHKNVRVELYFYYQSRNDLLDIDEMIHSLVLN
ncbi:MAG: hypothetical protein J6U01_00385 [Clostridia bacterium]|nr:hypothetical protein [Clostridia bacterium]